jgi:hypothetical protein
MNTDILARTQAASGSSTRVGVETGRSFVVQVEPDLAAGERINVGVCVVTPDGHRKARFVVDYRRLEHLYGVRTAELIEVLVDFARAAALSAEVPSSPSIFFTDPQPFFDLPADQYLDALFARVVPAGAALREAVEVPEDPRGTDVLWRDVGDVIKLRIPDRADDIIANTPWTEVDTQRGRRQVCVPLQPPGGAGALESADYSPTVTERKLMRALLDVEAAFEAKRLERMGLFIARPRRSRREEDLRAIDRAIDYVASRVPRACRVEIEVEVGVLAEQIIDWSRVRAA